MGLKQFYWSLREFVRDPRFHIVRYGYDYPRAVLARWRREEIALGDVRVRLDRFASLKITVEILNGEYEAPERELLVKHLQSDDVVLELGSALGVIATLCAQRIGSDRVFTFEANPAMIEHAKTTFSLNGVAPQIDNCMVSDRSGQATFYVSKHFWSSSSKARSGDDISITVPVRALAEVVAERRPSLLIVDIEGGEIDLFKGSPLPDHVRRVLIELHPLVIGETGVAAVRNSLDQMGFRPQMQLRNPYQVLFARA